ncbi:MAG: DNA-binding protein [Haliscomenobacter sp.]|nr:DNA-binding protein [Haliscomenobacter sp.]MBK7476332.1 DNA-binding protein [Haliscomenobacter sp.]MBK8879202.1 DNA-binding protein [Haliscomenobacter sp.]
MNITFEELRAIKHKLPKGSILRIAHELNISEQTVRNYFGAHDYDHGDAAGTHIEPGPQGGIVHLEDTTILDLARKILKEASVEK